MSWEIALLLSVLSVCATALALKHMSQTPLKGKRIEELEKRLATANDKIKMIESPAKRSVPFPFHVGGAR